MKTVLLLTYYWPPAGGPGVQRVLKFAKYLPAFGWQPVVLTVADGDYPAIDPTLAREVPASMPVHRVPAVEPYALYRRLTGKPAGEAIPVGILTRRKPTTFTERLAHWVRANVFIPDARVGWTWPVARRARQLIRQYDVQAILSSSPPHSVQLAARHLARRHGLPWIADFRDPWTDIYYYHSLDRTRLSTALDAYLERAVLRDADLTVTVSPSVARMLDRKDPAARLEVVYNGFDPDDFPAEPADRADVFSLAYVGNLKANQNPEALWKALQHHVGTTPSFERGFRLALTGNLHPEVEETLGNHDLLDNTRIEGYVPHDEAVRRMRQAAVLLFIVPDAPDNEGILTGKLFEYLASGRPFLAVGPPEGDAAAILRNVDAGPMLHPADRRGIAERIGHLYRLWQAGDLARAAPDPEKVQQFERRSLTGRLATMLDDLATSHP